MATRSGIWTGTQEHTHTHMQARPCTARYNCKRGSMCVCPAHCHRNFWKLKQWLQRVPSGEDRRNTCMHICKCVRVLLDITASVGVCADALHIVPGKQCITVQEIRKPYENSATLTNHWYNLKLCRERGAYTRMCIYLKVWVDWC